MPDNQIIHADCLEAMRSYEDQAFDLVLTDIPYGIGIHKMNFVKSGAKRIGKATRNDYRTTGTWDSLPPPEVFDEIRRVAKHYIIWGGQYANWPGGRQWLVWDKRIEDKYKNDYSDCELAITSFDAPSRVFYYLWSGFLRGDNSVFEKRYHPTQKPVELMNWCLNTIAKLPPGARVLDPFAGAGTTAIACQRMGYACVSIEISSYYSQITRNRLETEENKMILFKEKIG